MRCRRWRFRYRVTEARRSSRLIVDRQETGGVLYRLFLGGLSRVPKGFGGENQANPDMEKRALMI
jgi:hypothetical protein